MNQTTLYLAIAMAFLFCSLGCKSGPSFQASNLIIEPTEAVVYDSIRISVDVTNIGGTAGKHVVILQIDGVEKASKEVALDPGMSTAVSFFVVADELGTHSVRVDGLASTFQATNDRTPPDTTITAGPEGEINLDANTVTFRWVGSDDHSLPDELAYSYYLEGRDDGYGEFTSVTSKTYPQLPEGSYTFHVRAKDKEGNIDPSTAERSFTIAMPVDFVLMPGEERTSVKSFPVDILLPSNRTTIFSYTVAPFFASGISCIIGDKIPFEYTEINGERHVNLARVPYTVRVPRGQGAGIYDLRYTFGIFEGGGGRTTWDNPYVPSSSSLLGLVEFRLRVKVESSR